MSRWWRALALPGFVLALGLGLSACGSDERLDGHELRALYAGNVVEGVHERKGYSFRGHYQHDGTFVSYQSGRKGPRHGQWWVDGNEICIRWRGDSASLCRHVFRSRHGIYRKVLTKSFWREVDVVTYHTIAPADLHRPLEPYTR